MAIRGLRITGLATGQYATITYTRRGVGAVLIGEFRKYRGTGETVAGVEMAVAEDIHRRVVSFAEGGYPIELIETEQLVIYNVGQSFGAGGVRVFDGDDVGTTTEGDSTILDRPPKGGETDYVRRINRVWAAYQLRETNAGRKPTKAAFSRFMDIHQNTLYGWLWAPPSRYRTPSKVGDKRKITNRAKELGLVEKKEKGGGFEDIYTTDPGENVVIRPPDIASSLGIGDLYSEFTERTKTPRSASEIRSALF